jgi:hypothetical protein
MYRLQLREYVIIGRDAGVFYEKISRHIFNQKNFTGPGRTDWSPGLLFTIGIVGPFLDDPFRWLTPAASPGLPGRGRAPVLLCFFIIQTELF